MALSAFAESLIFPLLDFFESVADGVSVMHPAIVAVLDIGAGICRAVGLGGVGTAEIDLGEELIRGYLFEILFRADNFNGRYARLSHDRFISGGDIDEGDIVGTHELFVRSRRSSQP